MGNHYVPTSAKRRPNTIKGQDARLSILVPEEDMAAIIKIVESCKRIVPGVSVSCFVRKALQEYAKHLQIYASENKDLDYSMLQLEIRAMVKGTYADSK